MVGSGDGEEDDKGRSVDNGSRMLRHSTCYVKQPQATQRTGHYEQLK